MRESMTGEEVRQTAFVALIFAFRMLGLFMVLPVLPLYVGVFSGASVSLIGMAAGIYGLTQAICQFPLGILSDYIGRKPVIAMSLILFAIGSLVAAYSSSIWGIIIGRAIQGAGAVGAPLLALAADLTRESVRTRAMAIIGISIGLSFLIAILLGPFLDPKVGLSGLFKMTAGLASVGLVLLFFLKTMPVCTPSRSPFLLLRQKGVWFLNTNIFVLHAILTASFLILPQRIEEMMGYTSASMWRFYLPVLILSFLGVLPFLRYADHLQWRGKLIRIAMIGLGLAVMGFVNMPWVGAWGAAVVLFFITFNFLEASLPALMSQIVPKSNKGSALGLYSCSQFLGMFFGGLIGGVLLQKSGPLSMAWGCLGCALLGWLMLKYQIADNVSVNSKG